MDIFIININESSNISQQRLLEFKKKEFSNPQKLQEHVFSYFMLDKILKEHYKITDTTLIFKDGKPLLKNQQKSFSISHSGNFIALAFSDFNCGIDIEEKKSRDFEKIAKRMNFLCNSLEEFYTQWTLFEAKFKLNEPEHAKYSFDYQDYKISVVSSNENETFTIK